METQHTKTLREVCSNKCQYQKKKISNNQPKDTSQGPRKARAYQNPN
jgi:hypothetical protein